jgi:hypothetical protein
MKANVTTLIVAGAGLLGTTISAIAAVVCVLISRENRRKLTTPGEGTRTIGQQVEAMNK